jgi:hypothetical protein
MVAVDLLAKMHAASDTPGHVGRRFIEFTEFALCGTSFGTDIGEKVWAFRCALHHSYRLPSSWKPKGSTTSVTWRFRLAEFIDDTRLTWDTSDSTFINLYRLQQEMEAGIRRFHTLVAARTDAAEQLGFSSMFDKYGWLYVGE